MTDEHKELSAQAKEAKAKALLEKNKAKGLIRVDDTDKLLKSLTEKYGENTYDIVYNALVRPSDMVAKMDIKNDIKDLKNGRVTSAKLLQHIADNQIDSETLSKGLNKTVVLPKKEEKPKTECLDVSANFPSNTNDCFKTENVPVTKSLVTPYTLSDVETWARRKFNFSPIKNAPTNPGENYLAANLLEKMDIKGEMNPPNSGNLEHMTYSLKELKEKANLSAEDVDKILGPYTFRRSENEDIRVTRKAALYLMETNLLHQFKEDNPFLVPLSNKRGVSR